MILIVRSVCRRGQYLIVLTKAAGMIEPGKRPLHNPALGKLPKCRENHYKPEKQFLNCARWCSRCSALCCCRCCPASTACESRRQRRSPLPLPLSFCCAAESDTNIRSSSSEKADPCCKGAAQVRFLMGVFKAPAVLLWRVSAVLHGIRKSSGPAAYAPFPALWLPTHRRSRKGHTLLKRCA